MPELQLKLPLLPGDPVTYVARNSRKVPVEFTPERQRVFLEHLAMYPTVADAAEAAGITPFQANRLRKSDPEFAREWDAAFDAGVNMLEREAVRRATLGVKEPVLYKGEVVTQVTKYSDSLLQFLLRAHKPEVYTERKISELVGKDGGPVQTETKAVIDASSMTQEQREILRAALLAASGVMDDENRDVVDSEAE